MEDLYKAVTIVIPTLNEADGIRLVLEELLSLGIPRGKIVVIDGGSTDGTPDIARGYGVRVYMQKYGGGKAGAIKTALEIIDTPYMLVMDGDHTYPAHHIPELMRKAIFEGCDEVIGVRRYFEPGSQSLIYRIGNWALTKTFNLLFGTKLHDVLSGMYLVKVDCLKDALMEMGKFSVEAEIVAHMVNTGRIVCEAPIAYRRRIGKKKLGVIHGFLIFRDIIRLVLRYNPMSILLILGLILLIPGLVLSGWVLYWYLHGVKYYVKGLIGAFTALAGLQLLGMSFLSMYLKRMEIRIRRAIEALRR